MRADPDAASRCDADARAATDWSLSSLVNAADDPDREDQRDEDGEQPHAPGVHEVSVVPWSIAVTV